MTSVDPREVIASTVSDIRRRAGAYSQHAFMLATADMLVGVAERHVIDEASVVNPVTGQPWPLWVGSEPQDPDPRCLCGESWSDEGCPDLAAALAVCEAWRGADRTEATT